MPMPLDPDSLPHIAAVFPSIEHSPRSNAGLLHHQLRSNPTDLAIAHRLGALCFWLTRQHPPDEDDCQYWHGVIANWAPIIEGDDYWTVWVGRRSHAYGELITAEQQTNAQQSIIRQLSGLLVERDRQPPIPALSLELIFLLEIRAIRLLKQIGGLPISSVPNEHCCYGPLMVRQLGLGPELGQFVRDTPEVDDELIDPVPNIAEGNGERTVSRFFNRQTRRQLMQCFSELGPARAQIERGDARRAIEFLEMGSCSSCSQQSIPDQRFATLGIAPPRVCMSDCIHFANRNPAYALLPDRGATLFGHAVELMAEAYMALAEEYIRAEPPETDAAAEQWQRALAIAEMLGTQASFQDVVVNMATGRAGPLERRQHRDEAIMLLETALQLVERDRLVGSLAELLNARGVAAANQRDWDEALIDLRRALQLNAHITLIRTNLIFVLRTAAQRHRSTGAPSAARVLLEEAQQVLQIGIQDDPENQEWLSQLAEVQSQIAEIIPPGEFATPHVPLELGAEQGIDTTSPSKRRAFRFLRQGQEKAQQNEYQTATTDLEEALRLAPSETHIRQALADVMAQHAEALIAQANPQAALDVVRRGMMFMPDHTGLRAALDAAQAIDREAAMPADPLTLAAIRKTVAGTSLQYQLRGSNRFAFSFSANERDTVDVDLRIIGDIAAIATPIVFGSQAEVEVLYSMLHATYAAAFAKLSLEDDGSLHIVAEAPATLLTSRSLEELIVTLTRLVDLPDETLASMEELDKHVQLIRADNFLSQGSLAYRALAGMYRQRDNNTDAAQQVQIFCRQMEIDYEQRRHAQFHLRLGPMQLDVLALCRGPGVSFIAPVSAARPARDNVRFYQRMARLNAMLEICKLVLDDDGNLTFMYELPALDWTTFRQMCSRMEAYITRYGAELMALL